MNFKQPFYTVKLNTRHCGYRIAVNGCVIDEDRIGELSNTEYPINHYLKNGANSIDIYHLNIVRKNGKKKGLHEEGFLTLSLCVRENDSAESMVLSKTVYDSAKVRRDEGKVIYTDIEGLLETIEKSTPHSQFDVVSNKILPNENGVFTVGQYQVKKGQTKALQITQTVTLPAPFPLWRFFQADDLPPHNDLSDDEWIATRKMMIEQVYQPVYQALLDDDTEALTALFAGRGKELDQAFYKKDGQDVYEMVKHLKGIINNPDFQPIRALKFDYCDVAVAFNQKMTWLHNWDLTMSGKLEFKHKEAEIVTRIPVQFARFDGNWEIVR
jgi:hypothetical protein